MSLLHEDDSELNSRKVQPFVEAFKKQRILAKKPEQSLRVLFSGALDITVSYNGKRHSLGRWRSHHVIRHNG
jgi:hypothetical protein